jgi:OmpA-OmpF porin, OOP family
MPSRRLLAGLVVLSLLLPAGRTLAFGPGDLKKKAEKKAREAAEKAAGKTEAETPVPATSETASEPEGSEGSSTAGDGTVGTVSTKFDFVPGAKVLLMDDFTREELGEFPAARWKVLRGNFDTVEFKGERWFRLNGTDGLVAIKSDGLPDRWTLEFDFYQQEITGPVFTVGGLWPDSDAWVWSSAIGGSGKDVAFSGPEVSSTAEVPGGLSGRHHVSLMANGQSVKVYVDRERVVNIPEMEFKRNESVAALGFRFWRYGPDPMITNVRFAEGGKEKVDMMATPFVTQGIVFDSGSDRLKPESAPVLRQVATYLKENAEVKVMITGHTDDVGETAANLALSEKRAAAVAASLSKDFSIDGARMATSGKGESVPMAANDSPEGKAMNRRVEFAKN